MTAKWLLWLATALGAIWATAAVYYTDVSPGTSPRAIAAILFGGVCVVLPILVRSWKLSVIAIGIMFGVVLGWFFSRTPLEHKNWMPDVAKAPRVEVSGNILTVHNLRNFAYRSETDFTERWETRQFDLSGVKSVDYILSHWGSDAVAHVIVSFGFDDGQFLAVSIETRKERGEEYSTVQGFFRQYELVYVFADERDIIRLRTDFRHEDVYMFRLRTPPWRAREVLLSYVERANELAQTPEFYNALSSNCSTNVIHHFNSPGGLITLSPWHLSLILTGYSGRLAYEYGATDQSVSYNDLRQLSHINAAAIDAGDNPDFSRLIRVGVPTPLEAAPATSQPGL